MYKSLFSNVQCCKPHLRCRSVCDDVDKWVDEVQSEGRERQRQGPRRLEGRVKQCGCRGVVAHRSTSITNATASTVSITTASITTATTASFSTSTTASDSTASASIGRRR